MKGGQSQGRNEKIHPTEYIVPKKIARRDEKPSSNEQCKEIEEYNRMGKTRDISKNSGDIKGTFHARMCAIKDRNGKNLTLTKEGSEGQGSVACCSP